MPSDCSTGVWLQLTRRHELYTAIRGTFGGTDNLHPFPEIDVDERFPTEWAASSPAGLCTGNNSALLSFRAPRHDFWGGSGDLELLTVDTSLLDGDVTVVEVSYYYTYTVTNECLRYTKKVLSNQLIAFGLTK